MTKRKRLPKASRSRKSIKLHPSDSHGSTHGKSRHHQRLLKNVYREVKTLKEYLLDSLPSNSRLRRKRVLTFAEESPDNEGFLSKTLVALSDHQQHDVLVAREQELDHFTQAHRAPNHQSATAQQCSFDEIIDFVIWSLFKHLDVNQNKPNHVLCGGLERSVGRYAEEAQICKQIVPGVLQKDEGVHLRKLKSPIWQKLLSLAGADGQRIFCNLLLDYGIYIPLENGVDSYYQLSGIPLHSLCLKFSRTREKGHSDNGDTERGRGKPSAPRKPSDITIVRSRILYSKPSLNRQGRVQFGLKHMHILNRLTGLKDEAQNIAVTAYIFPRQFRLHNVFTSSVDKNETVQAFKDYTFRENELHKSILENASAPRRLRGHVIGLVRRLRRNHHKCSYDQLFNHYCPVPSDGGFTPSERDDRASMRMSNRSRVDTALRTQLLPASVTSSAGTTPSDTEGETSFLPYTTDQEQVSSFCRATLRRILPSSIVGVGRDGHHNWQQLMDRVGHFVRMRKFETTSLHELVQGLKITSIAWLAPEGCESGSKLAATDKRKREELLHELIYYIFDSLLIPLINSNFYVTESGVHRNKLLYFRHDVWNRLCQPCLASAKLGALIPVSSKQARSMSSNQLGYSLVRLLPKETGTRSITNLKRRTLKVVNGKRFLAPSINARLTPVFNIFNYERQRDDGVFKSDSFSTQHLHKKLSTFKAQSSHRPNSSFYIVKADIQSAFDSIPQEKLLSLVQQLFRHSRYGIAKHAESKWLYGNDAPRAKPGVKFIKSAVPKSASAEDEIFGALLKNRKRHVIYSDTNQQQVISREQGKKLLDEHIQHNVIKVGNKHYKQSIGIPQGSILSSLLCTFFYNDFEQRKLDFLDPSSSLVLRIIDDFLLITTNKAEAMQFVKAMKDGDASYGIHVHPEKSLVNFDMSLDGVQIPKLSHTTSFPFCGLLIDTGNLQVSKDRVRKDNTVANTLTVDLHGHVGERFKRRVVSSLKIQLQSILLDTTLNDKSSVIQTIVSCFQETAMKMHQYYAHLPEAKQPSSQLLIALIEQLIGLVVRTTRQHKTDTISHQQVCCLAAAGIIRVLTSRSVRYPAVLHWLRGLKEQTKFSLGVGAKALEQLVEDAFKSVQHYVY